MSLVRIHIDELKIGMFVDKVESSAVSCPIKQTGYIRSEAIVMALRHYDVEHVVIDLNKKPQLTDESNPRLPPHQLTEPVLQKSSLSNRVAKVIHLAAQAKELLKNLCNRVESLNSEDFSELELTAGEISNVLASDPVSTMLLIKLNESQPDVYDHSINTAMLTGLFSTHMGFEPSIRHQVVLSGLLHDIGLTTVPRKIIENKNALSDLELKILRGHVDLAQEILDLQYKSMTDICKSAILHHHEHIDGSGYPNGLAGDDISFWGKILALTDAYESMTSNRYGKSNKTNNEAMATLLEESHTHFDASLVAMFAQFVRAYPAGSVVLCSSEEGEYLGIVSSDTAKNPIKPCVIIFYDVENEKRIKSVEYDLNDNKCPYSLIRAVNPSSYIKHLDLLKVLEGLE